jgi:hypothetical protein
LIWSGLIAATTKIDVRKYQLAQELIYGANAAREQLLLPEKNSKNCMALLWGDI